MSAEDWSPEQERDAYTARAQAIVEALASYEVEHPSSAPCLHDALAIATKVMQP